MCGVLSTKDAGVAAALFFLLRKTAPEISVISFWKTLARPSTYLAPALVVSPKRS